jgi:pimeloyl-ACP methyl ester carboxylesterase
MRAERVLLESSDLRPESRFVAAADGTRIAYREIGEGPPIVLTNGLSTSDFFWHHLAPRWAEHNRVVTWDYKGHGDSGPARSEAGTSMSSLVDDLRRVMDAASIERSVLVGFSMGCQVIVEAWRVMPERIAGLGLVLGPAGRLFDTALSPLAGPALQKILKFVPPTLLPPVFGAAHQMAQLPGSVTLGRWLRLYGRSTGTDIRRYVDHFGRLDPQTVVRIALHGGEHDARAVLPTIRVPTLVVAGDRDVFAPPRTVGLPMHAAIPGARLLRLADGTHGSLFEHPNEIDRAVRELVDSAWARDAET